MNKTDNGMQCSNQGEFDILIPKGESGYVACLWDYV